MISALESIYEKITSLYRANELEVDEYTLNRMEIISKYIQRLPRQTAPGNLSIPIEENDAESFKKRVDKCIFCDSYVSIENILDHAFNCAAFKGFKQKFKKINYSLFYYNGTRYDKSSFSTLLQEIKKKDPVEYRKIDFFLVNNVSLLDD